MYNCSLNSSATPCNDSSLFMPLNHEYTKYEDIIYYLHRVLTEFRKNVRCCFFHYIQVIRLRYNALLQRVTRCIPTITLIALYDILAIGNNTTRDTITRVILFYTRLSPCITREMKLLLLFIFITRY